ncbi:LysR family transcriptional regulator (plasmid) [Erwinia sp. E602]|uniref:LysR substrate-binding domain-containing protein n=1 Tax=Erwinia sp. E602 TaxID=2675378 RepID=UPI001BA715F3|nr:LysR substrate-binding domain-containing protein [Erwinia sp. E602]QUG73565.1 LysR family transcriptional regulator [Erwinia sp. E602]
MPAQSSRLPKISVIQSFKVASELGSLTKAAAQLALTPAAVSQQIRQLEEQLGSTLFLRTQNGVMLTETGKEYLRYVTEAFDILHLGQQNIHKAASVPRLTVYALPALASKWLLPQLAGWRARCPNIDLSLHGTHAQVDFAAMPADFVICFGEDRYPQLDKQWLFHDEVLPVASPALLQRFSYEDILSHAPLIHLDWGNEGRFLPDWRSWFQARGMDEPPSQPAFSFNLTSLAIDAAVLGCGLLLGQRRLIAGELARGELVVIDNLSLPLSKPYFLAWPQRTLSQPGGEAMIHWLRESGADCR